MSQPPKRSLRARHVATQNRDQRSPVDLRSQRLDRNQAKKLIGEILRVGQVVIWDHATREMEKDDMTTMDAQNVLRCGKITEEPEFEGGAYRYRVQTEKMLVVVELQSETELSVITAWRKR